MMRTDVSKQKHQDAGAGAFPALPGTYNERQRHVFLKSVLCVLTDGTACSFVFVVNDRSTRHRNTKIESTDQRRRFHRVGTAETPQTSFRQKLCRPRPLPSLLEAARRRPCVWFASSKRMRPWLTRCSACGTTSALPESSKSASSWRMSSTMPRAASLMNAANAWSVVYASKSCEPAGTNREAKTAQCLRTTRLNSAHHYIRRIRLRKQHGAHPLLYLHT
jgi:hypothetical protein